MAGREPLAHDGRALVDAVSGYALDYNEQPGAFPDEVPALTEVCPDCGHDLEDHRDDGCDIRGCTCERTNEED